MSAWELYKTILKDSSNLKAYYRMEAGALTTDSSGNGYTLTNNNTVADGTGLYGGAGDVGAANTNKDLTISSDLTITSSNISISLWVKLNAEIGSGTWVLASQNNNTTKIEYEIDYQYNAGTRRIGFHRFRQGTGDTAAYVNTTLGTSSWHHIVLTYDGTTLRGFVDGTQTSVAASGSGSGSFFDTFSLFSVRSSSGYASCLLDDVAVFNTALSADQVKELYEGRYIGEWMPQSNLVGLWHLNGNSTDASGNNNHGTDTNVTYSLANGKIAQGAGIPTNGKIAVADSSSISITGNYTINAWIYTSAASGVQKGIFEKYDAGDVAGYLLRLSATNKLVGFNFLAASYVSITGGTTIPTNTWTMVTSVYDGTNLNLYVNGKSDATPVASGAPTNGTRAARIGNVGDDSGNYGIAGAIDELAIFSRALTAAEIRHWYAWSVGKYL